MFVKVKQDETKYGFMFRKIQESWAVSYLSLAMGFLKLPEFMALGYPTRTLLSNPQPSHQNGHPAEPCQLSRTSLF